MGDLQATIEFLVELYKFYNVDLFIRGYYQFRLTFKPPKSSHGIQVEVCKGHGERGAFTLFPAFLTNDGQTAVSRTFNIYYKDEEVLLKDVFLFRVHLLIDSTKAADCIDKAALEMTVDVHFTDQVVRENNYRLLPLATSRTLKFHFSCFNGLHHQVPLLFDYYYFSILDMIVHANVVSLGIPNWSILKPVKTGWFSKSTTTPRSSTPLFYTTLFGSRSQFGLQFYSDVAQRYAVTNAVSKESFEKASAVHRNLCAILAMAHSQLLNYFDQMMYYLDEKQRIKLGEKLDPADLVEGLCKKLETLRSCEEVFDEMCSDMSVLNNELALLWSQFQESFILNDQIRPILREQHHYERIMHFSEAFFVHELPWKSLLNVTDSSFQKHVSMGQCVKSSRYLAMIPPVTIECPEVDGDSTTTPIFFEDRYVNRTGKKLENFYAVHVPGGIEEDVLEHKPLGILNQGFNDLSPQVTGTADSSDVELDSKDLWVDIKTSYEEENPVTPGTHTVEDTIENQCKVTENVEGDVDKRQERRDFVCESSISPNSENGSIADACVQRTGQNDNLITNPGSSPKRCAEYSKEASISTCPKTLLEFSLEKTPGKLETLQKVNDHIKNSTGSQGHCEIMRDTGDTEPSDLSDIRVTVGSTGDQQNRKPKTETDPPVNGVPQENKLEAGTTAIINEGVETKSIPVLSEETQDDICSGDNESCLKSSNNQDINVNKIEEAGNDNKKSSPVVVQYSLEEETNKKKTSVQNIRRFSDAAIGDKISNENKSRISEQRSFTKEEEPQFAGEIKTGSKQGEFDNMFQVDEAGEDQCTSPAHDNAGHWNKLSCSSEETMSFTASEKSTDVIIKEPGCNDFVTKHNSDKGSKVRNTSHDYSAKRVSNSVFYEGFNCEENGTEEVLEHMKIPNPRLENAKLSSNSSSEGISCFCGGQLMKMSSPYRPRGESDTSNLKLQKAKQDVRSRMNYCGTLYSDFTTEFVVKPYFMNPKPDLSLEPLHFVVCVHGLDGNSGDLRLVRCFLEMALPSTRFEFLMSEVNQDNTFATFEKQTDKLVSEILHYMEAYRVSPSRISFIGHSLGNIIIRSALTHPQMEPYVKMFHTFLSLSGPHLGMVHHTSSLVSTGMWLLQKWKKSDSLLQLSLNDSANMRDTFMYKLSKKKGLEYFTNVLLVSSVQDHYAPFHSSRIELPKSLRSNSQEYIVYREMMENLLTPLLNQPNRSLVRYSVYHCLPSSTNTFIGRAAHIAMLDSELFIEKLICTSAAKYFQ